MSKKENIKRFTAEEIKKQLVSGADKTNWQQVQSMSQSDVERLANEEDGGRSEGWEDTVMLGLPPTKKNIHIRLDNDVLDWFKAHGIGYQTRINAVLRAYVTSQAKKAGNNHSP
ncbi:MAG: BrnA antitoxin family protein [Methylococcales bacterium]